MDGYKKVVWLGLCMCTILYACHKPNYSGSYLYASANDSADVLLEYKPVVDWYQTMVSWLPDTSVQSQRKSGEQVHTIETNNLLPAMEAVPYLPLADTAQRPSVSALLSKHFAQPVQSSANRLADSSMKKASYQDTTYLPQKKDSNDTIATIQSFKPIESQQAESSAPLMPQYEQLKEHIHKLELQVARLEGKLDGFMAAGRSLSPLPATAPVSPPSAPVVLPQPYPSSIYTPYSPPMPASSSWTGGFYMNSPQQPDPRLDQIEQRLQQLEQRLLTQQQNISDTSSVIKTQRPKEHLADELALPKVLIQPDSSNYGKAIIKPALLPDIPENDTAPDASPKQGSVVPADSKVAKPVMTRLDTLQLTAYYARGQLHALNEAEVLQKLAEQSMQNVVRLVILSAYTDRSGGSQLNRRLAAQRLDILLKAIAQWVSYERILLQNFGDMFASNEIKDKERRIEIRLLVDIEQATE